ncbi:anthranilate synthase component I family protein [Leucobacter sp. USCH14]|uniref:anthranilate synthase component I family protein n=1 Tax=Leucobacter sp. USCH14 TaxID=3024838 RepID=UPI0030984F23
MPDPTPRMVTRALSVRADAAEIARRVADTGRPWFWFDGAGAAAGEERVSTLGIASEVRVAAAGGEQGFMERMQRGASGTGASSAAEAASGRRLGFRGGWVVALTYEFGASLLGLATNPHDAGAAPAGVALRCDVIVAVDHETGDVELRGPSSAAVDAWLAEHGAHLLSRSDATTAGKDDAGATDADAPSRATRRAPRWRRDDSDYAEAVEQCRDAIREGEAYVLCLTDTAETRGSFDAIEVYRRLREAGAPMRGGIIDAGTHALVSASPERFLSIRGPRVETHPIKGTRRRGGSEPADRALAAQLVADPKERAENLMIVDLMRNDLSRVCAPGSVRVDRFLDVETHAHVHQLVSTVSGELANGADVWDVIAATFPGGSMTGAPKRRAVQLLQRLEAGPRGFYSGCFGWVDHGGDAELAMTIRTIELRRGERPTALVGAGGGVTVDSLASREVAEKHVKAAALLAALR